MIEVDGYKLVERPGYFGRRRDEKIAHYNATYGEGKWELRWLVDINKSMGYEEACYKIYETSYLHFFYENPDILEEVARYKEVIDNAETNILSGLDYTYQESYSTHIQDIAIRNCLKRCDKTFSGMHGLLVVRGPDTLGWRLGLNPGQVKAMRRNKHGVIDDIVDIKQPSKKQSWAQEGSVEDFWQSNKYIALKVDTLDI